MKIDKTTIKHGVWYEDINGNRIPCEENECSTPEGAHTYHSVFPLEITEHIYIVHSPEEKKACRHPRKYLKKDRGLVKGMKGRICTKCGCSQIRKWWQPWGKEWDERVSFEPLMDGHVHIGGGNQDLILAMVNSGDYTLSEALAVYAGACERCSNVLAYKYLNGEDGYPEFSEEWKKANTECSYCKGLK